MYKTTGEIRKTKKGLDFFYSNWFFPFQHSPKLPLVHHNTIFRDDISKKIDFTHVPFALLLRKGQLVFLLALQQFLCQSDMIHFAPAIDKDVIKVDNYSIIKHIFKYLIYHILECFRSVSQPKWHDCILIMTIS